MPGTRQPDIGAKIRRLRADILHETQTVFGERFGVEQATVSRWERGWPVGDRSVEEAIAALAGMSVAQFFHSDEGPRLIPVIGQITGRGKVSLSEKPMPGGPVDHISLSLGDDDQIGLRVVGNAWFPAYRDGDVLIATRFDKTRLARAVGHDCILKILRGDVHIRIVKKGSKRGTYTLRSLNPQEDDIEDVELEWAAPIIWINRA